MEDLELKKLDLEELKIREEIRIREEEIKLQKIQFLETQKANRRNVLQIILPASAAVIAGLIGLWGNYLNGQSGLRLEQEKQRGELIRKFSETKDGTQTAKNLVFLAESGLLDLPSQQLENLRKKAGVGFAAPVVSGSRMATSGEHKFGLTVIDGRAYIKVQDWAKELYLDYGWDKAKNELWVNGHRVNAFKVQGESVFASIRELTSISNVSILEVKEDYVLISGG